MLKKSRAQLYHVPPTKEYLFRATFGLPERLEDSNEVEETSLGDVNVTVGLEQGDTFVRYHFLSRLENYILLQNSFVFYLTITETFALHYPWRLFVELKKFLRVQEVHLL